MAIDYVNEVTCSMNVSNLDGSITWYENVLGFSLIYRVEEIQWAEMKTGAENANLGLGASEKVTKGGGAIPTWTVCDIEAAKSHLDAHDVKQDGDIQTIPDMVRLLTFYDPDGNAHMFAQSLV